MCASCAASVISCNRALIFKIRLLTLSFRYCFHHTFSMLFSFLRRKYRFENSLRKKQTLSTSVPRGGYLHRCLDCRQTMNSFGLHSKLLATRAQSCTHMLVLNVANLSSSNPNAMLLLLRCISSPGCTNSARHARLWPFRADDPSLRSCKCN